MKHILFTLKGCSDEIIDDAELIRMILFRTVKEVKATLLHLNVHKFEPQGVTGFALLAESHISIHTWPEKGMAVCDVFTCGDHTHPKAAAIYMADAMGSRDCVSETFNRPLS